MTVDLAEFLIARIRDEEAKARAATPGPWRYNAGKEWFKDLDKLRAARAGMPVPGGEEFVAAGPDDGDNTTTVGVAATGPSSHPQSMKDADFIASWDPARVLAECDAKKAILELHRSGEAWCDHCSGWYGPDPAADCPTLRLLALPYADHPDYDETWRP